MTDRAYIDRSGHSYEAQAQQAWNSGNLELILFPTEQCNFRCQYCYEDFEIGRMSRAVVDGVRKLVERSAERLHSLRIIWFGGEPLAALDTVMELSTFFQETSRFHGIAYSANMTTNGYTLSAARAEELAAVGISSFQVTLDGPKDCHDRSRVKADGSGTFDRIWNNLKEIKARNVPVDVLLRLHLTAQNAAMLETFADDLRETFLDDVRFSVLLVPIGKLGGPNDDRFEVVDASSANSIISKISRRLAPGTIHHAPPPGSSVDICYAAKPNSFVIRADGQVGKCTVTLKSARNAIGRLHANGDLEIDDAKHSSWLRGWIAQDLAALKCPAGVFTTEG